MERPVLHCLSHFDLSSSLVPSYMSEHNALDQYADGLDAVRVYTRFVLSAPRDDLPVLTKLLCGWRLANLLCWVLPEFPLVMSDPSGDPVTIVGWPGWPSEETVGVI